MRNEASFISHGAIVLAAVYRLRFRALAADGTAGFIGRGGGIYNVDGFIGFGTITLFPLLFPNAITSQTTIR